MQLLSYIKQTTKQINYTLEQFAHKVKEETSAVSQHLVPLIEILNQASEGGKRLRAILVVLGYEVYTNTFTEDILKPAIAFEIFQTAILVHDDIIDLSPTRRGKPTVYKQLEATKNHSHYGVSQAICLGDIGMFLAVRLVSTSNFDSEKRLKAVNSFVNTLLYTGIGEMLDVELPYLQTVKEESDVLAIYLHKTAHYTITGALQLGATLGGATDEYLAHLAVYGNNLGIAFQIQDDILGIFGDEEQTGKSTVSDIEEGKITLLYLFALKKATVAQKSLLENYYGKGQISEEEANKIRKLFIDTGALAYCETQKETYVAQALSLLDNITQNITHQTLLKDFANLMIQRKQ
jgi:geranylgeranyl diphosphate synthase type I